MKKFKLLSSMLAVVMVLSMIFAMPVGAIKTSTNTTYFNDFNHLTASYTDENTEETAVQWRDFLDNEGIRTTEGGTECPYQNGIIRTVYTDAEHGVGVAPKALGHFYIPLPNAPATSGKVKVEFSYKAGQCGSLSTSPWGVVRILTKDHLGTNDRGTSMVGLSADRIRLLKGSTADVQTFDSIDQYQWYKIKIEIDIDTNTWTVSKNGTELFAYTYNSDIPKVYGITFYCTNGVQNKNFGVVDDLKITVGDGEPAATPSFDITNAYGTSIASSGNTGANGLDIKVTAVALEKLAGKSNATVIYALYNDDELVDADSQVVSVTNGGFEQNFTTKANVSYDSVKAFIWDGLTTMTPLVVAKSYPAE